MRPTLVTRLQMTKFPALTTKGNQSQSHHVQDPKRSSGCSDRSRCLGWFNLKTKQMRLSSTKYHARTQTKIWMESKCRTTNNFWLTKSKQNYSVLLNHRIKQTHSNTMSLLALWSKTYGVFTFHSNFKAMLR